MRHKATLPPRFVNKIIKYIATCKWNKLLICNEKINRKYQPSNITTMFACWINFDGISNNRLDCGL